ncbi:LamG domain-containing protein [Dactylosporangium roseum]|uniref:LamG domain-containing protein n=1 Tax=Dactylosporangium roseum TaxID=47989 RepID=A0ABY5Z7N1_9ACTN|nr:LamG domain-containing protein [Dactylosporangium roseum]UWZ36837.1 LamG domain-containing protein [Dactylosporangium roseum]
MRTLALRRRFVLSVALVPVVAAAAWIAHRSIGGGGPDAAGAGPSAGPHAVASAKVPGAPAAQPSEVKTPSAAPKGSAALRYSFDGGLAAPVVDAGGRLPLKVRKVAGGELSAVPHEGGLAVRFPPRCEHYGAESCARAILQSGPADFLNPGQADFSFGASVLVKPSETSKGANVMQKGFSVGDSQFKLQVDGAAGRPSCVIVGTGDSTIYVALASRSVADGRWHRIECSRGGALLTVAVDGVVAGQAAIPPSLSIMNTDPLCIGGKGTSANNDQFVGVIDDVFVTRSA